MGFLFEFEFDSIWYNIEDLNIYMIARLEAIGRRFIDAPRGQVDASGHIEFNSANDRERMRTLMNGAVETVDSYPTTLQRGSDQMGIRHIVTSGDPKELGITCDNVFDRKDVGRVSLHRVTSLGTGARIIHLSYSGPEMKEDGTESNVYYGIEWIAANRRRFLRPDRKSISVRAESYDTDKEGVRETIRKEITDPGEIELLQKKILGKLPPR